MIYGNDKQLQDFAYLEEKVRVCLEYLKTHNLKDVELGTYEIDGKNMYVNVMEYETVDASERVWESHRKYLDIHYMVTGAEQMDFSFLENMTPGEYDAEKDLIILNGEPDGSLILREGDFMVCYPKDVHRTAVKVGEPAWIRKAIFKVRLDDPIEAIKGKLIVSCQALPHEPLHSSYIMGRMAAAAKEGGAAGIRANTREDIAQIKAETNLPVIGIVKRDYEDSKVYITPTMKEIEELMLAKPEIIAMDATIALRPGGKTLDEFFKEVKERYPNQLFMADCSTVEEALHADELGFDFIGTTMVGYTEQSKHLRIENNDFEIIREIVAKAKHPVIAEGNINTPEKVKRVIELGCFSVVVGSIITRPQLITKAFADVLK